MQTYPFGGGSTRLHVGYGTGGICAEVEKEQEGGQGTDTIYYDEITAAKYTPDSRSRRAANGDSITAGT